MKPIALQSGPPPHLKLRPGVILVGTSLAVLAILATLQLPALLAHLRLRDAAWWREASPTEMRETAHKALGLWVGDPHDAFVALAYHGDSTSIPYLREALANMPPQQGGVECTWAHAQWALDRILSESWRKEMPGE